METKSSSSVPELAVGVGLFMLGAGVGLGAAKLMGSSSSPAIAAKSPSQSSEFNLDSVLRANIKKLKPYRCARDDYSDGILLDANENALGPPVDTYQAMCLERYPCPYQRELKTKYAAYRGVDKSQVFVGVGSDEAIDLLFRLFCIPGKDAIVTCPPTYGMYKVSADINDTAVVEVPLTPDTFQLRTQAVLEAIAKSEKDVKLLFACSPGNPTARSLQEKDIQTLLEGFKGIVVVDEAYVDFSSEKSLSTWVAKYPNLVVLQTLSKAFGLAGIRCGMALASKDIVDVMNNVKAPYSMNKLTSRVANEAMGEIDVLTSKIKTVLEERERVASALKLMAGVSKVFPSDTNFLLFQCNNAEAVYKDMADSGIVIRFRGTQPHCGNCNRVTIGTKEENDAFLKMLAEKLA